MQWLGGVRALEGRLKPGDHHPSFIASIKLLCCHTEGGGHRKAFVRLKATGDAGAF